MYRRHLTANVTMIVKVLKVRNVEGFGEGHYTLLFKWWVLCWIVKFCMVKLYLRYGVLLSVFFPKCFSYNQVSRYFLINNDILIISYLDITNRLIGSYITAEKIQAYKIKCRFVSRKEFKRFHDSSLNHFYNIMFKRMFYFFSAPIRKENVQLDTIPIDWILPLNIFISITFM
jgi:hypothetical protein